MRLIVIANSYKSRERCLAGIDVDSGRYIRPVSRENNGAIPSALTVINGYTLRPGDLVELNLGKASPTNHHPEDYEIEGPISLLKPSSALEYSNLILSLLAAPNSLIDSNSDRIAIAEIEKQSIKNSLALVQATDISFFNDSFGRSRVRFIANSMDWTLSNKDASSFPRESIGEALVCISLADKYEATGSHHKLAVGFIDITRSDLETANSAHETSAGNLPQIVEAYLGEMPAIESDSRLDGRFWFFQSGVDVNCLKCNAESVELFRAHDKMNTAKGPKVIHRYAILCRSCKTVYTTPFDNEIFRKSLQELSEAQKPVKSCCRICFSNLKSGTINL